MVKITPLHLQIALHYRMPHERGYRLPDAEPMRSDVFDAFTDLLARGVLEYDPKLWHRITPYGMLWIETLCMVPLAPALPMTGRSRPGVFYTRTDSGTGREKPLIDADWPDNFGVDVGRNGCPDREEDGICPFDAGQCMGFCRRRQRRLIDNELKRVPPRHQPPSRNCNCKDCYDYYEGLAR